MNAPNSADYGEITATRYGGFWDTQGGVAHLRGLKDRLGEIASGLGDLAVGVVTDLPGTIDAIRNPVVREGDPRGQVLGFNI